MHDRSVHKAVKSDIEEALDRKIKGTPTFFIGDKTYLGEIFPQDIERMLEKKAAYNSSSVPFH
jgi:protein-disulfide isomerase